MSPRDEAYNLPSPLRSQDQSMGLTWFNLPMVGSMVNPQKIDQAGAKTGSKGTAKVT